jgi:hypothetical protein
MKEAQREVSPAAQNGSRRRWGELVCSSQFTLGVLGTVVQRCSRNPETKARVSRISIRTTYTG